MNDCPSHFNRPLAFADELEKLWKNVCALTDPISKMAAEASAQAAISTATLSALEEWGSELERRLLTLEHIVAGLRDELIDGRG